MIIVYSTFLSTHAQILVVTLSVITGILVCIDTCEITHNPQTKSVYKHDWHHITVFWNAIH